MTCSPHLVETRVAVAEAVAPRRSPDVELARRPAVLPAGCPTSATGPTVQLWPHRHGTDAMFLALLRRTG